MVDTSSPLVCPNFPSPCDVQQIFSFAGRSLMQDIIGAFFPPGHDAVELSIGDKGITLIR